MSRRKWVWGLRTVAASGTSNGDFKWPAKGRVEAPDWDPRPICGGGLHFLLWGAGGSHYLCWRPTALWQVVRAPADEVVDLGGKAKAPWVEVVYTGDREAATALLARHCPAGSGPIHGATATVGEGGTATAGDRGAATAGDHGHATADYRGAAISGDEGTSTAGDWGTAAAGDRGTATAGVCGTATAGVCGTAAAGDEGTATAGRRGTATAGEGGIATAGDWGRATAGRRGTATAGVGGIATAGEGGTATAGRRGTATSGYRGILVIAYYVGRPRLAIAYVGRRATGLPKGVVIEADTPYRVVVVGGHPRWEVAS